jgi:hypothetical protein
MSWSGLVPAQAAVHNRLERRGGEAIMPGFKSTIVRTKTGTAVQLRPVVLSIELTREQQETIRRVTGQYPERLELSESDLNMVLVSIEAVTMELW